MYLLGYNIQAPGGLGYYRDKGKSMSNTEGNLKGQSLTELLNAAGDLKSVVAEALGEDDVDIDIIGKQIVVGYGGKVPMVWENGSTQRSIQDDEVMIHPNKVEINLTDGRLTTRERTFQISRGFGNAASHVSLMGANVDLSKTDLTTAIVGLVDADRSARQGTGRPTEIRGRFAPWQPS